MRLMVSPALSLEERVALRGALQAEITAEFGAAEEQELAILLQDEEGTLQGGLVGTVHWNWLYIRWLWVAEAHRGNGWGQALLNHAENEAWHRGCHGVYIDTFSARAMALYERCGYSLWGTLGDFPPGHTRRFLKKILTR